MSPAAKLSLKSVVATAQNEWANMPWCGDRQCSITVGSRDGGEGRRKKAAEKAEQKAAAEAAAASSTGCDDTAEAAGWVVPQLGRARRIDRRGFVNIIYAITETIFQVHVVFTSIFMTFQEYSGTPRTHVEYSCSSCTART
jgi:hypothetical protein